MFCTTRCLSPSKRHLADLKQTRAGSLNRFWFQPTWVNGPCPGLPFCEGCAQAPSHLVLDPLIRGATASVLDTWTVVWNRRFSGGSRQSQG
jgi:hypothetical protein